MNRIELSQFNIFMAGMVGVSRQMKCIQQPVGYKGIDNRKRGWQDNCDGALGEQAFAKWLGVFWDGTPNTFRTVPDVDSFEVRTNSKSWGDLFLRERDKDEAIYVLVLSHECPVFEIKGWIRGCDGKRPEWLRRLDPDRPEAWVVPQTALRPMEELPR